MNEFVQQYETLVRLFVFLAVFSIMAIWEVLAPKKELVVAKGKRWLTNWSVVVINSLAVRFCVPILAVAWADTVTAQGWGLLNHLDMPLWAEIVIAIVVLDMLIYWQHVLSHRLPILWKVHRIHHADRDIDVTTGARFHPIEIVLSTPSGPDC